MKKLIKRMSQHQRIVFLEKELHSVTSILMRKVDRIEQVIGITDTYIHKPVKPLKINQI